MRSELTLPFPAAQIAAITAFVEDLAGARRFYIDVFELDVVFEDDVSCVFRFGDTLLNLRQIGEAEGLITPARMAPADAGTRTVLTVTVADVDAALQSACSRGARAVNGPARSGVGDPDRPARRPCGAALGGLRPLVRLSRISCVRPARAAGRR